MFTNVFPKKIRLQTLGDFLPYVTVIEDVIISKKPSQLTAVLEVRLSELDDLEVMQWRHDNLISVLCDVMPDNATLSVYLSKRFVKEKLNYRNASDNKVIAYLDKKTIDDFNADTYPFYTCFFAITIPVLSAKSFTFSNTSHSDELELKDYSEALETMNNLIHAFKSRVPGTILRLSTHQIYKFLSILINHKTISNASDLCSTLCGDFNSTTNAFNKFPGYVYYGGNYHTVLSLRAIGKESHLPSESDAGLTSVFYTSNDLRSIPFTVHHSIKFISKQEGLTTATLRKNSLDFRRGLAERNRIFAKTEEGVTPEKLFALISEAMSVVENTNHRFVKQSFQVHLWDENLQTLWKKVKRCRNSVSSMYLLKVEKYNIKPSFFSIFPGNESVNKINTMLPTYTTGDMIPIELPRECHADPDKNRTEHIYFHTAHGSIAKVCTFSSLANAYNAMICGGTGSGKSFLMNSILYQEKASFNPIIIIIDVGGEGAGSYRNFVLNNNGTYIEITPETPFSINPFDGPFFEEKNGEKEPIKRRHEALRNILSRMIGTKDSDENYYESLPTDVMYHLDEALIKYFEDTNNNNNNVCNLHDFAEKYLKNNSELLATGHDLYKALAPFIGKGKKTGVYAAYFRKTDRIRNPDVVCFDLMGLAERPRLAAVLIPTLLEMTMGIVSCKEHAHRRKDVTVDEAWKFLKGGSIAAFIELCFATIRKNFGKITILTQNIQSIADSPIAKSLFLNTSYYYLVGKKHPHDPEADPPQVPLTKLEAGDNKFNGYDIQEIRSQRKKGEFYLLSPFFCGKLRFKPSVEFTMLSTTDPNHKVILNKYKKKLGEQYVTQSVMEAAREEFVQCLNSSIE